MDLAERASAYLRSPEQAVWRARLALEQDNVRAALGRTIERGEAEPGLRICIALWHFWIDRGDAGEGYGWLTRLLALESAAGRTVIRAAALFVAAKLAFEGGDLVTALALGEESLEIAREVDDPHTRHRVLTQLGHIARGRGEWLAARRLLRGGAADPARAAASRSTSPSRWPASATWRAALHEYETARALYDESLALAVRQGHPAEITAAQHDLGRLAHERGHDDEAARLVRRGAAGGVAAQPPAADGVSAGRVRGPGGARRRTGARPAACRRCHRPPRASGSMLPPADRAALELQLDRPAGARRRTALRPPGRPARTLTPDEAVALALAPAGPPPRMTSAPSPQPASPSSRRPRPIC